jgi:hypothetical protein
MSKKIVKSNKLLIVILVALIIIGVIILTNLISFSNIEDVIVDQIKHNQMTETEHAAKRLESHIIQVKDELLTLSKFPPMENIDVNECSGNMRIIHEGIEGRIDSLIRVDKDGNVVECSSKQYSNYLGLNVKNKDYFAVPKETSEPYITGFERQGESLQIIISTPLYETIEYTPYPNIEGKFQGILMSIIELNNLYNLYIHSLLENSFFLLIDVDTEETIIKSRDIDDFTDIKSILPDISGDLNIITNFGDFGNTVITSSDLFFGQGHWRLIILTPLENVGKEIASVQKRHVWSLGFVILIILSVFIFLISLYKSKEVVEQKLEKANVTLEKLGINIELEKDKFNQAEVSLDPKKVYLIKEDEENHAYELFIGTLNKEFAGLGIVREDPRKIKEKYNLQKTSFIWLTNNKVEDIPCETDIDNLFNLISEFVKKSEKSVILLDRLDYILTENEFESVIKKIHDLKDLAEANECIIILSLNPELVDSANLKAIEAETVDLYGKHLRKRVELSDIEMNMLKYINEQNITNRLVSYKDITSNFNITKPTTRVKINKLQGLALVTVEQKGRFKSLKITSAGRRILN